MLKEPICVQFSNLVGLMQSTISHYLPAACVNKLSLDITLTYVFIFLMLSGVREREAEREKEAADSYSALLATNFPNPDSVRSHWCAEESIYIVTDLSDQLVGILNNSSTCG